MTDVTIRDEPGFTVAAMPHQGPYYEIGRTYGRLAARAAETGLAADFGPGIAFYYDDPSSVPPEELRSHAGCTVPADRALPEGFDRIEVAHGRIAVAVHQGPYDGLPAAWDAVYGTWLPASGEEAADRAPYERYLNDPMTTAPQDLLTEICIPLRG